MTITSSNSSRIHSLDSLRGIMMMLGIVLHSAITYGEINYGYGWSLKDPNHTDVSNDFIVALIHSFRMQTFFLVAGFFGALLFYERSPKSMIRNRLERIVLPFLAFLFILWPTIKFAFTYSGMVFNGDSASTAMSFSIADLFSLSSLTPTSTFHLWFLYDLIFISSFGIGFAFLGKGIPRVSRMINILFSWLIRQPILRVLVFGLMTAIVLFLIKTPNVPASASFVPNFLALTYYFSFYMVGWILFKSKDLLNHLTKGDWISTLLGLTLFTINFIYGKSLELDFFHKILINGLIVWLLIFGITGLFIRYASHHSPLMRYLSDSSYWVYLAHLTFTALIPGLIKDWEIASTLKFLFVMTLTGIICFVSYHFLVRDTFIGKFLNGRRYPRKLSS